ncbi:MAG: hypothetical protein KHX40_02325 [Oscillospiraceae bacterium]|nr:hypothetical protein [Oscillospiraceae bacterium]
MKSEDLEKQRLINLIALNPIETQFNNVSTQKPQITNITSNFNTSPERRTTEDPNGVTSEYATYYTIFRRRK